VFAFFNTIDKLIFLTPLHLGGMVLSGGKETRAFLSFTVHIHSSILWWSPHSNHHQRLGEIITDLRNDREMSFPLIADWLNDNGYKTPRRHAFTSSHTHPIDTKSNIRSERYGKTFYSQLKDIKVTFY